MPWSFFQAKWGKGFAYRDPRIPEQVGREGSRFSGAPSLGVVLGFEVSALQTLNPNPKPFTALYFHTFCQKHPGALLEAWSLWVLRGEG